MAAPVQWLMAVVIISVRWIQKESHAPVKRDIFSGQTAESASVRKLEVVINITLSKSIITL